MLRFLLIIFTLIISSYAQTGVYKSYDINGEVSAELSYSDGIYDGTSYWYYPNGNLKEEKTYSNGKLNGWVRSYYESGLLQEEKYVKDGMLDGIYRSYYPNGALKAIRHYKDGFLLDNEKFEPDPYYQAPIEAYRDGNRQQRNDKKKEKKEYLCDVDICPEPLGGMESIYEKLVYPAEAKAYGLEGIVTLVAKVNTGGKVIGTRIIKGLDLGCSEAAQNAVEATRFLPGQDKNGTTTANVTLDIEFKLEATDQNQSGENITKRSTESIPAPKLGVKDSRTINSQDSLFDKNHEKSLNEKEIKSGIKFECDGVDVCAKPKAGISAIFSNLIIPTQVKSNNVKGEVVVECTIGDNGQVTDTEIIKGLPQGANVAVEVALIYTEFEPALIDGKPVKSQLTVTVPIDY